MLSGRNLHSNNNQKNTIMKLLLKISFIILLSSLSVLVSAQQSSPNKVKFMITYDKAEALYTAWVVPDYRTPNFNNPDSEEKGATAQVSIKVPSGFVMTSFANIKGKWDGSASKIGSEPIFKQAGLNTGYEYYILGKSPSETNYGVFEVGEPVALFSFAGNAQDPSKVQIVESDDEFVDISINKFSLNVAPSFYSRSGQQSKSDVRPLEQFVKKTTLTEVVEKLSEKLGATESMLLEEDASKDLLVYPNPAEDIINIKYFSLGEGTTAKVEFIDQNGSILQDKEEETHRGFNTTKLNISNYSGGTYVARVIVNGLPLTTKVIKIN